MTKKTKLELTWIGKDEAPSLEPRILLEDPEKGYAGARPGLTDNRVIFGDNLLALKAVEQELAGKVKCVYIDPPYNTGSAFEHYDDGIEHSLWLSLMRPRIQLLWSLVSTDGSMWVSIDDSEMPYLRVLMDEICGRGQFIACNVWQKRYSRENREAIGDVHEYVLTYAKTPTLFKAVRNLVPPTDDQVKVYRNPNGDPRGRWRPIPLTAQAGHATAGQFYEITAPSGRVFVPPEGRCWGVAQATYEKMRADGRIYFGKDGDSQPNSVRYLSEVEGYVPWTWWPHDEVGHTDESKKEIQLLFGKEDAFDTPKPERLLQRILHIATNPGDLVLDSFAGSGTTGAVAHKMGRRWILVELGEHCHTHVLPRLRKVVDGEDPGGITEAVSWKGGGGFRYYRLAPSLLEQDPWGNWVISKKYDGVMLAEALCKLEGFSYAPSQETYWKHGHSTERDFLYATTQTLTFAQLERLSKDVGPTNSLLVLAGAFKASPAQLEALANLTVRKIPQSVLTRCEFGKDDYSLHLPEREPGADPGPTPGLSPDTTAPRARGKRKPAAAQSLSLFDRSAPKPGGGK